MLSCWYTSYVYDAGPLLLKTTAYSMTSLQQSSCSDYYVHGVVNQPIDDHYFTVFVIQGDHLSEPPLSDISLTPNIGGEVFG